MAASDKLRDALVAFAVEGQFPDDVASLPSVSDVDLQPTIDLLEDNKAELEGRIHTINEETKGEVSSWVTRSKALQEDIVRSKSIANDIIRESEAPLVSGEVVQGIEEKTHFLEREVRYSKQLLQVLSQLKEVNALLSEAERASDEHEIGKALEMFENARAALAAINIQRSSRPMRLVEGRAAEVRSHMRDALNLVWTLLVDVDVEASTITICEAVQSVPISLTEVSSALRAFNEVDERMEQLWHNVDGTLIKPRTDPQNSTHGLTRHGDTLGVSEEAESSGDAVLSDVETALQYLAERLPETLFTSFAPFVTADLVPRIIQQWLEPAVPSSLDHIPEFQDLMARAERFCDSLVELGYTGVQELQEWVGKSHMTWLRKCRETALDSIRHSLTNGIGQPRQVERVERHMVSVSEGKDITKSGAGAAAETNDWDDEWNSAWDDAAEDTAQTDHGMPAQPAHQEEALDDGADAWGWDDEEKPKDEAAKPRATATADDDMDDVGESAWGWSMDEDGQKQTNGDGQSQHAGKSAANAESQTRELVLKETYHISAMPDPIMDLLHTVLQDGATLTENKEEHQAIASTAPGLFGLPTLVLALFRAISPHYYSSDAGGNMFLYNDATYLAEQLAEFSTSWKQREDLTPRAKAMLRLDNDVKSLQSFANRNYSAELNLQKTILRDFLGGAQSLMQQDDTGGNIEAATTRIRQMASTWEPILARSVWSQAVGSLADTVAAKIITDVLDMSSIGQDEAYNIAKFISMATELDDLFLPSTLTGQPAAADEVPTTSQYAPNWLRLKYLSEVLQSNLNEVKYLWQESELSLYFTSAEVTDLINASFEDNARTRETIKEIQGRAKQLER